GRRRREGEAPAGSLALAGSRRPGNALRRVVGLSPEGRLVVPGRDFSFTLAEPRWLLLLALVPLFWWIARRWASPLGAGRRTAALVLRACAVAALALAMSGFTLLRNHDDLAVLFLVDRSDSVPAAARANELDFAREAMKSIRANDRAGIVAF